MNSMSRGQGGVAAAPVDDFESALEEEDEVGAGSGAPDGDLEFQEPQEPLEPETSTGAPILRSGSDSGPSQSQPSIYFGVRQVEFGELCYIHCQSLVQIQINRPLVHTTRDSEICASDVSRFRDLTLPFIKRVVEHIGPQDVTFPRI